MKVKRTEISLEVNVKRRLLFLRNIDKLILPSTQRSALGKFRCGVVPIRTETGRYASIADNDRLCPFCDNVESEIHKNNYFKQL